MKSLSSILKSALEAKNAAKPEKKTRGRKKKTDASMGPAPSSEVIAPKKTRRSTRGG